MQCTVLQPKGTLRTSTLPTGVSGIPSPKDIAAVLRRATEPELAASVPAVALGTAGKAFADMRLLLFGYKTGKTGTENQHGLTAAFTNAPTLYGEAVVVAVCTKDGEENAKPVAFPTQQWTQYIKMLQEAADAAEDAADAGEDDEEDGEEDEDEFGVEDEDEKEAEGADTSDSDDDDSSDGSASEAEDLVEEEEEEVAPLPVFKAPRTKRSNKKTPQWLALPPATLDAETPQRTAAKQQIQHFLHTQLSPQEQSDLERGILAHTIAEAQRTHVHPVWENREFGILYDVQVRRIISNMSTASYVANHRLDVRYREGEFTAAELPTMPYSSLCPEKWKDLFEKEMKREAKMLEVDKSMATDMFRCTKCGKRQCTYYEMQTRSADEPMTIFVRCLNCGKRWRQ